MTTLLLYKFIQRNKLEIDWRGDQLVLWVDFGAIGDFARLIRSALGGGGMDVNLQESYIALDIVPLCEHYGIDPTEISPRFDEEPLMPNQRIAEIKARVEAATPGPCGEPGVMEEGEGE